MAFYENERSRTYISNAALLQFVFVTLGANGKIALTALGGRADGVTMTEASAVDQAVTVPYDGRLMVRAGGVIARGGAVSSNALGQAIAALTTHVILGYAAEAAVAGQIMTVEINRAGNVQP